MKITKTMERNILRYLRNPISQLKKNGKGQLMWAFSAGSLVVVYIMEKLKCSYEDAEMQYGLLLGKISFDLGWDAEIYVEEDENFCVDEDSK